MLLEQLAERHRQTQQFDWDAYYRWYFKQLAGEEFDRLRFWMCERCMAVNRVETSARYAKCRGCQTLHPRFGGAHGG